MEYYSAITKNTFESVLMRWMKLELIYRVKQAKKKNTNTVSVEFSSVTQSCPTLCNLMTRSIPSLPVHHQLLELAQTQVHQVGDAIEPSPPLSSPSPPALNLSQRQGLFK